VFQGGSAKNHRAHLPGIGEIGYHPHGLHALEDWCLAKHEKSIAKLPELSKCVEVTLFTRPRQKGETPPHRGGMADVELGRWRW
jgi:hypothetical protein